MTSRYGTLDVALNSTKNDRQKLNRTLQVSTQKEDEESSRPDNEQKVNKFKQLYFKNQKLRKELKLLNQKLNEKLQKLKLPSVKKKALSVDFNQSPPNPPSKALVRQLQNAYKQIAMYKKQVQALKGKEDTPQNYDKLRNTQNMVNYMDMEINQIQQQLKSIKNIKKLQDKVLLEDVDTVDQKQRLSDYQRQVKSFKDKIKEMQKKSRRRQQDFKKQQAYLVALQQKNRKYKLQQLQLQKPQIQKPQQAGEMQFHQVKQEIKQVKQINQQSCKKIEGMRKQIKNIKQQKYLQDEQLRQREVLYERLLIQVQTFTRLLKDLQLKKYQLTGVKAQDTKPIDTANRFLKLQQIQDSQSKKQLINQLSKSQSHSIAHPPSPLAGPSKDEREWKNKNRKVSMGYATPTDTMFQESGILLGLKIYQDQNKYICGLAMILLVNQSRTQSKVYGNTSSIQLKWQVQPGDYIGRVMGSFTQQGYLASISLVTWTAKGSQFGNQQKDTFQFNLQQGQYFSGIFGGLRRLGQDVRITEMGFWISRV